jgi:transketolase
MFASKNRLNNLTIFVDFNKWQATGRSEDILDISNLVRRWCSFGWDAIDINGHCFSALDSALNHFKKSQKPKIIICNTIKGKGVSFMEDDNNWHYRTPNKSELDQALKELEVDF